MDKNSPNNLENDREGFNSKSSLTMLFNKLSLDRESSREYTFTGTRNDLQELKSNLTNLIDSGNIQRNESQYLASHETMSENEYNKLFSGKEKLQQGQLGDCYLVSGIHELARAQHFDTLMRTSIQRVKRRNGDLGYQIKIPLGEPSGRKILLKDSEISVAKIRGNTGYKLLELAYAKNKLRKNDRNGNRYCPITPAELKKITGGWTKEVLQTFLGKHNIGFNTFGDKNKKQSLDKVSNNQKTQITGFLKNYVPSIGNKFVSLSSIGGKSDTMQYTIGGKTLYYSHAYALTKVNKDGQGNIKSITVLNPWNREGNGKNYQDFTLDEFFQSFSFISCGKIKTKTFLDEKSMF